MSRKPVRTPVDLTDAVNPEWTDRDFARAARPGDADFPDALYKAFPRTGRPDQPPGSEGDEA